MSGDPRFEKAKEPPIIVTRSGTRKKKETEPEKIDILQLDLIIKQKIKEENGKIDDYLIRREEIRSILSEKNISFIYRGKLEDELMDLNNKIDDIESDAILAEYLCMSEKLISEHLNLSQLPIKMSFFGKEIKSETVKKSEKIINEFIEIAKKYITVKTYKKEEIKKFICECGNFTDFINTENTITCEQCSLERTIQSVQTSFKDIDRVNMSQKYKYEKKVHFRDTVNQYQGKQNKKISDQPMYDKLEEEFLKFGIINLMTNNWHERHTNVSKDLIYMILSENGYGKKYEDINYIHNYFTGKPCPDMSFIEKEIFEDFDLVVEAYNGLPPELVNRTNFLHNRYVLYQLLRRRKVKVDNDDFDILKTRERLIEHDEMWEKICEKLEWNYNPTA